MIGNRNLVFIIIVFLLIVVSPPTIFASPQPDLGTGEWWLKIGKTAQAAYVGGVVDGFDTAGMRWVGSCTLGKSYFELRNIVKKYLDNHAENQRHQMVGIVIVALTDVCKKR